MEDGRRVRKIRSDGLRIDDVVNESRDLKLNTQYYFRPREPKYNLSIIATV